MSDSRGSRFSRYQSDGERSAIKVPDLLSGPSHDQRSRFDVVRFERTGATHVPEQMISGRSKNTRIRRVSYVAAQFRTSRDDDCSTGVGMSTSAWTSNVQSFRERVKSRNPLIARSLGAAIYKMLLIRTFLDVLDIELFRHIGCCSHLHDRILSEGDHEYWHVTSAFVTFWGRVIGNGVMRQHN